MPPSITNTFGLTTAVRIVRITAIALATVCLGLATQPREAGADLRVNPTRIVVDEQERSATLNLVNNGAETRRYRIEWRQHRMAEDGRIVRLHDTDDHPATPPASSLIRYSPRAFELAPGQSQTVRLMVRAPEDLEAGEYLSHLSFLHEPTVMTMGDDGADLSVAIDVVYGVSVPVIYRHGDLDDAEVAIRNARLSNDGSAGWIVEADLQRSGPQSVYGHLELLDGGGTVLATQRGVGVYTELTERPVRLDVPADQMPAGADPSALTLRLIDGEATGLTILDESPLAR